MIDDDDKDLSQRLTQQQMWVYFRRILRESLPERGWIAACLVASLATACIEVYLPRILTNSIDLYMVRGGAEVGPGLLWSGITYVGWAVVAAGLSFLVAVGFNAIGQKVVARIRNRVFEHLHRLPVRYFDGNPVGRLVTRVANDTANISEFFTGIIANLLCDLLKLLVLVGALCYASPQLTAGIMILAPPMIWAAVAFQRASTRVNRELRKLLAQLNAFIQENLQGLTTIKAFTAETAMAKEFDRQNMDYYRSDMQVLYLYMLFRPLFHSVSMLALAIVLYVGGWQVQGGQISVGTLVLFIFYLKMLFAPLDDLAERFNVLQTAAVSAERIFLILDASVEPGQTGIELEKARGDIEFRNVNFAYDPAKPVLQSVNFSVKAGQKVALVGATGSGKTTITALLQRLYPLQSGGSGEILLDGRPIEDYQVDSLRRQFGVIQQELYLFRASLRHNITLFRDLQPSALQEALRVSRAERVVEAHAEGLERMLGERGGQLSQGERQLVSFARALAGDPPILILDEATASIDSLTEEAIQQALAELLKGRTALIVAHRLSTIQSCDNIVVLDHGKIVEQGTHRELLALNGAYAQLVHAQEQATRNS